ncbi:MAG: glycosyltransferase family 2 protein, partial [Planctomycetes bacterium]|nr:glycosyltransferase family 2 protein [Planctomycetota bacterium]
GWSGNPMATVSAVVLTRNEEEMLPLCLDRLRWADEILVVDSWSEDRTVAVAEAAGARVLRRTFTNFSDQTNWAYAQATGDWVLQIDADELVTPALRDAVLAAVADPICDIYLLQRNSCVFGRPLRSSSWSGEWIPRLFRRGSVTFAGEVHQDPQVGDRPTRRLDGVLIHYPYRSTKKYFEKFQLYSTLWAEKAWSRGRRTSLPTACVSGLWRVFHDYFVRGGIRDGRVGFTLAILGGMHTFIRHIKLWGLQQADEFARVAERNDHGDP